MSITNTTPTWLNIEGGRAVVSLSVPLDVYGEVRKALTMRCPTMREDVMVAHQAGDNDEQRELLMLGSLCELTEDQLTALQVRDYRRLQRAYKELLGDDSGENPAWLKLTLEHAVVHLVEPIERDGVKVDRLTLQSPSIRLSREVEAEAGDDNSKLETLLFQRLTETTPAELHSLTIRDYNRVRAAYFRLVHQDGV
ncbi:MULTISPECIES: phage tail assembly protein [unclassified Pseudomonas]|uniref:phage tail assembly protein n=1 Tax=unclassified Pseudomonas TaxID=196821 RepID=UPI000A09AA74|nr:MULTISPECIES: phage tail assembly protein [unclassified Pseudomonas]SMF59226.1 Phage tail assembly chaperone protein, E, or 41 or 14 [Pseudomonas sp. LAIL14HWK12:I11]SMR80010.1 Phage tail assembly chaperone protein, E, or 41 or 14 [Pseudomonas sp. LAIL14HWK12:I10]SOD07742.1 Phage tail assembly chaperone protein, E, or 41 or 14 [Pseudomonas sp. LAIL14HWK12:I8]